MNNFNNHRWMSVILLALWTLDGCIGEFVFQIGGLGVYFHLPIMGLIIFLGGFTFLVNPHLGRAKVLTVQALILLVPVLLPIVWSLFIWIVTSAGISGIRRGFVRAGYVFFGILAIAATAYTAGEKVTGIYLFSLVAANILIVIRVISEDGVVIFFTEFAELIISFAQTTGTTMKKLEIHRITYGLGPFIVAYFVKGSRMKRIRWMLPAALFCYLTGFKRIGVAAVLASIVAAAAISAMRKYNAGRRFFLRMIGVIFILLALLYVAAVYFGLYDYLEQIGINTNLRSYIYSLFQPYYRISPFFLGQGTGWVDDIFRNIEEGVSQELEGIAYNTHNDYLRSYIELGMIGFLAWCYTRFNFQVSHSYRKLGINGGTLAFALTMYMAITCATDPTSLQVYINCSIAAILFGFRLETRERWEERKMEIRNRRYGEQYC